MKVNVFRVFVNEDGKFGNPVGIVVDEKQEINSADRQTIASEIGFSEAVFINDLNTFNVNIFNPQREVNFAGHALVGTAYFITKIVDKPINSLTCKAGQILTWQEDDLTWIRAGLADTPPWNLKQLPEASLVDNLPMSQRPKEHMFIWAWLDKSHGIIRARTFAPDWGIPEDEANGSGSMQLVEMLKKSLEIHHGKGSIIYAKPAGNGLIDIGGRVEKDEPQSRDTAIMI